MTNSWYYTALTTIAFLVGLIGNIAALWILHKTAKRRNKKHLFMLRCLATNDLMAQVGMLFLISMKKAQILPGYLACAGFVFLRAFGLGSGCVALVMALERWLALTRPFLYHQLVTYRMLKRFLCSLWLTAVFLTYLPFFGFGLYYNSKTCECLRYRNAVEIKDRVYAYLFFLFGSILCLCIALCNTSVICELSRIRSQQRVLVRRISRSIISNRLKFARDQTPEEVAFAKLMAFVCVIFVACWLPQLMTVPIVQFLPPSENVQKFTAVAEALLTVYLALDPFVYVLQIYMVSVPIAQLHPTSQPTPLAKAADALLCFYYMLDPFVYVLQHYIEGRLPCCRSTKRSNNSFTTSTNSATTSLVTTPSSVVLHSPSLVVQENETRMIKNDVC